MTNSSRFILGVLAVKFMCSVAVRRQEVVLDFSEHDEEVSENSAVGICSPSIIEETCSGVLKDLDSFEHALALPAGTGQSVLNTLGVQGEYSCTKLCDAASQILKQKGTLPPSSDVGCIVVQGKAQCNIDLTPATVATFLSKEAELPDMGDKPIMDAEDREVSVNTKYVNVKPPSRKSSALLQDIVSSSDSLADRTARLFRINPMVKIETKARSIGEDVVDGAEAWKISANEINVKSQAYLAGVMRKFGNKNTEDSMIKWFGQASYEDMASRNELERVMNGVSAMLDRVEYVYDKSQCGPRTYAFVYPKVVGSVIQNCIGTEPAEGEKCVQNSEGKFMFFLCDVYMKAGEAEQIETLIHEGSHHASAYTTDVCVNEFFLGNSEPLLKKIPVADIGDKAVGQNVWVPMQQFQIKETYTEVGGDVLFNIVEITGGKAVVRVLDDFDDCMNADAHVAYGRGVCQALAKLDPVKALKNADNICYYIVDAMTGNGASTKDSCRDGHGDFCVGDRVEMYSVRGDKAGMIMFPEQVTPCYGWGCDDTQKCTVKFDGKEKNEEENCGKLSKI